MYILFASMSKFVLKKTLTGYGPFAYTVKQFALLILPIESTMHDGFHLSCTSVAFYPTEYVHMVVYITLHHKFVHCGFRYTRSAFTLVTNGWRRACEVGAAAAIQPRVPGRGEQLLEYSTADCQRCQ